MFDIGWSELAVIAVVALVVIGPKDLPKVLRTAGFWMRKVRSIASEFQSSLEQMAREAELDELRKQVEEANKAKSALEQTLAADAAKIAAEAGKLLDEPSIAPPGLSDRATAALPPGEAPGGTSAEPAIQPAPEPMAPPMAEAPDSEPALPAKPVEAPSDATHRG